MTYKEKNIWAMMISSFLVALIYVKGLLNKYGADGKETFKDVSYWAKTMLVYVLIFIVVTIVIMITFNIGLAIVTSIKHRIKNGTAVDSSELDQVIEDEFDSVDDEMDYLIALKANKLSHIVVEGAFFLGLFTLAFDQPMGIMLNMVFISYMVSSVVEGLIKLYFYKRGVRHG